jgi:hypothetical protein
MRQKEMHKRNKAGFDALQRLLVGSILSPPPAKEFKSYLMRETTMQTLEGAAKAFHQSLQHPIGDAGSQAGAIVPLARSLRDVIQGTNLVLEGYPLDSEAVIDLPLDQFVWPQLRPTTNCRSRHVAQPSSASNSSDCSLEAKPQDARVPTDLGEPSQSPTTTAGQLVEPQNVLTLDMVRRLPFSALTGFERQLILERLSDGEKYRLKVFWQLGGDPKWNGYKLEY